MVTVVGYNLRAQKEGDKKNYIALEIEGEIEMVQSQNTGRHYATVRRCIISSTFDEMTASRMVGKQMPGSIVRVPCENYQFTVPESGEVVSLAYRWDYVPENAMRMYQPKQKQAANQEPKEEVIVTEKDLVV